MGAQGWSGGGGVSTCMRVRCRLRSSDVLDARVSMLCLSSVRSRSESALRREAGRAGEAGGRVGGGGLSGCACRR